MSEIDWASPQQEDGFHYGPAPLCLSGGFGSAKTYALCLKALYLSDLYPKNRGVIARKVGRELRDTTMATFFKLCPPAAYNQGARSDQLGYLTLNNGSTILWLHLDSAESEGIIKGLEINWFLIDQAEEVEEEVFTLLSSRLGRWDQATVPDALQTPDWPHRDVKGRCVPPTYPMIACNPDHELHWIYRRFHPDSQEHKDRWSHLGYKMIQMNSLDNKFLTQQARDHLLAQDETFQRRYIHAKWGSPEARIHAVDPLSLVEWTPELIGWLTRTCTLHRSLDHGDSAPTSCLWWAVDRQGNCFAFREYYQGGKRISEHRRAITEMSRFETYQFNLADPSIFHKVQQRQGGQYSIADEYEDASYDADTALYFEPADNNELGTRNRINEYLTVDPERLHPISRQKGAPRLYFVVSSPQYPSGCRKSLEQLKNATRIKIGTEQGKPIYTDERDPRVVDHGYDPCRYFIASRPPVAGVSEHVPGPNTFWAQRRRLHKQDGTTRHLTFASD